MRAILGGVTVLDSRRGVVLHETGHLPEHYYPVDDLDPDLLSPAEPTEAGAARWDIGVAGRVAATAVTAYADPSGADGGPPLADFVAVDFAAMDRWFEEDDPVYGHLRDPYHRVDVRASSRRVVVRHQGQVVAESARPKLLFETGNPTRYYLPFADIDLGRLELSDTVSECPYKGDGQHWHLITDGEPVPDVAWSLPHPLPEGFAAAEHLCFYPNKVDLEVDGEHITD
ncbi:MAG: DUF427 domain-containing protein [Geodermatophilaceae bacterium]